MLCSLRVSCNNQQCLQVMFSINDATSFQLPKCLFDLYDPATTKKKKEKETMFLCIIAHCAH